MDIEPLYRLTVYAPSSEDPTETAVLTPIAGAAHADPFVVTTKQGIAGAQPYLDVGKGRQGSINYTTKRTTTGNLLVSLLDRRVTPGGSNAVRWVTAFIGNARGETRLKGCKFLLERALDGTEASLVPFTAGRIRNNGVTRATRFDLELKDFADDLNRPLFKGAPHSSIAYAALGPLLPNGVVKPFGNLPLTPPLAATIGAPFSTAPDTVVVNVTTPSDPAAMITQAVLDSNSSTALRLVELTKVADGTKHYYQWPRGDSALASTNIPGGPTPHFGLTAFPIAQLPVGDLRREALPAVGTAVTVSIVQDAPPSEATPLLVNDVHPVQYIADILDGKFSLGPGETTLRPLAVRNTDPGNSWATLLADPSFDTIREVITKLEPKANDYLEKVLLQRYNLVLDRDGRGRVDLVDLRRKPTLAGVVTLTDDDLVTATDASWDDSRDGAITAVVIDYYVDQRIPATDLVASSDTFPTLPPALIRSTKSSIMKLNDLSTLKDVGEKVVTIAARGDRISSGDLLSAHFGRQRRDRLEGKLAAAALDFLRPIGSGVITAQATYRMASANAQQIAKGKYCIVQHSKLPDPASNERGGARLMLCLSCDERDGTLAVQWMDAGTGAVAVVPNTTGVTSANPYSVDVAIVLNGDNDPADIYVAATDTTVGVRPADNAAEWVYAGTLTTSGTVRIGSLPTGKRIWTRAQSHGTAANVKLPSAWDYAPAPGYLDLAAGDPIDLSQPDPVFTPIATTADVISPPSCYAFENPVRSTRTTANIFLRGAVGEGSATPLSWRYTVGNGAPSAWSTAPITGVSINVTRDKFYPTDVLLEVTQPDGQSASFTYAVGPNPTALDPGSGQVDPAQPLAGTSHFIPRATDVNGMILDPGVKDSRTAPLNGMFRYGTDTAVGVMETAGLGFTNPGYLDGSRRPVALRDGTLGADVGAAALNDGRLRAVSAIDPAQNGLLLAAAKDSRSAPLNAMGRTGVDSIASWLDGGGFSKVSSSDMSGNRVAVLHVGDTRNTNAPPSGYSQGVTNEFKDAGAIGIPGFAPSSGVFGNLRTEKPWSDSSGGYATQTWAGSDGRVWKREAAAGGASWPNPWRIITETQTQRIDRSTGHADSTMQDARSFPLNQMGRLGTDTLDNWLDGTYKKPTVAQVGYADRAGVGLDSSGYVQSGIRTAATVAGLSAALLSRRSGALFVETYDVLPQNNGWAISGAGGWSAALQSDTNSTMGRNCLITTNYTVQSWGTPIPINPNKLYRLRARVRTIQYHAEGAANTVWYIGVIESNYHGDAANANSGACYCVAESANPGLGGFVEYVGWMKGCTTPYATTAGLAGGTAAAPAAWNVGTVAIQPYILAGYPNGGAGIGGQFMVDYFLIDEFDEDGTMRTYNALEAGGQALKPNVKQYDGVTSRVIAKGHSTGAARFPGAKILFPENYQNPPLVLLRGGLLSEPRAKWGPVGDGSESGAFNAALPVYDDLVALNLDPSGFDLRARLRQKSGSTARSDNFPAGNSLSGLGATTQATLANAPANNDTYTANYTVSATLTPFPGGSASLDVIVALDTSNDSGGTWQTRATKAYSIRAFGSPRTISWNAETMVAVAQLQAPGARVRLRIDTVDWTDDSGGTMSLAVHGRSGGGDGSGVTYNTSADNFASKTPDAEDLITWEAIEVS